MVLPACCPTSAKSEAIVDRVRRVNFRIEAILPTEITGQPSCIQAACTQFPLLFQCAQAPPWMRNVAAVLPPVPQVRSTVSFRFPIWRRQVRVN